MNKLGTYILHYYAGPGSLINCCKLCCFLSRVSYLSLTGFAKDSCSFRVKSYKTVIKRRSYFSCIIIIERFDFPVCLFWHCKSKDPVSATRKSVDCFACCLWYCHVLLFRQMLWIKEFFLWLFIPTPCCGRHCFYMRCCRVFSGLLIVPLLLQ